MSKKDLLTVKQFAEIKGVTVGSVYQIITALKKNGYKKHREFIYKEIGTTYLISPTEEFWNGLEAFKESRKNKEKGKEEGREVVQVAEDTATNPDAEFADD